MEQVKFQFGFYWRDLQHNFWGQIETSRRPKFGSCLIFHVLNKKSNFRLVLTILETVSEFARRVILVRDRILETPYGVTRQD